MKYAKYVNIISHDESKYQNIETDLEKKIIIQI